MALWGSSLMGSPPKVGSEGSSKDRLYLTLPSAALIVESISGKALEVRSVQVCGSGSGITLPLNLRQETLKSTPSCGRGWLDKEETDFVGVQNYSHDFTSLMVDVPALGSPGRMTQTQTLFHNWREPGEWKGVLRMTEKRKFA